MASLYPTLKGLPILVALLGSFAGGLAYAQAQIGPRHPQGSPTTPPSILSGDDIGFRVESPGRDGGSVTGRFVVRIDGEWVNVTESVRTNWLTSR